MKAHIEESGSGIRSWWVSDDNRNMICVGDTFTLKTADDALLVAKIVWSNQDALDREEADLRGRHPDRQIFHGPLPCHDVAWEGEPKWYLYVLKDRRRHGKWQVLEAI